MIALEAASEWGKPVILQSAPDGIFYAGSLYLLHMFEQAQKQFPTTEATFILDCDGAGAEAIAAMSAGHKHIRSDDTKIRDIAAQHGVTVHSEPYEALDLPQAGDTKDACKQWLEKTA